MDDSSPQVTLAMPVFNGENYIGEAISSILSQSYEDFELIITDNASTDSTPDLLSEFARSDSRIRYIQNGSNIGAAGNYNLGFSKARGKYFKWCAHDDCLSPNFLEKCVAALDQSPEISVAFAATLGLSALGKIIRPTGEETPSLLSADPAERFRQAINLAGTCFPIFGLFRSSQLARSTLHRPYYGSDRALIAEMAVFGKFLRIDDAVFFNREHETRSINIDDKLIRSAWQSGRRSRRASAEHINLTRHLSEISGRHRDIVSPASLRKIVLKRSLSTRQLGRYGLELTAMIFPNGARVMKSVMKSVDSSRKPDGPANPAEVKVAS